MFVIPGFTRSAKTGRRRPPLLFGNGTDGTPDVASGQVGGFYEIEDHEGFSSDVTTTSMSAASTTFDVRDGSGFASGQIVMLHQTQVGRTGNLADTGKYEIATISSVSTNTITLSSGITNSYTSNASGNLNDQAKTQLVKVVRYKNLTVPAGVSIRAKAWDGFSGGILAILVKDSLAGDGEIGTVGRGWRGGTVSGYISVARPGEGNTGYNQDLNNTGIDVGGRGRVQGGSSHYSGYSGGHLTTAGAILNYGTVDITARLPFGGGGGGTNVTYRNSPGTSGAGAVYLGIKDFSGFTGNVRADGVTANVTGAGAPGNSSSSGAGAGGSVLVESETVFPDARVFVNAGQYLALSGRTSTASVGQKLSQIKTG